MRAEIIAIGSELLLGGVADTNSLFLAEELLKIGIEVRFKTVVGDDPKDIEEALLHALGRAQFALEHYAEAEAAFQTALGRNAAWYLDQIEDAVGHPQEANELVTELTGAPAQSVVQWAAQNAELFSLLRC